MPQEVKFLSASQYLLTTLVVKIAVVAILSTMLVRFRWFRRILLTERRDRPEQLIFAASLGLPLTAGVAARLLLNYNAADLSLEGAFLAGLLAGPYAGALVGFAVGLPPVFGGEFIALPLMVGSGFAGGGLREACPKETIWSFSPLFFTYLPKQAWRMLRRLQVEWHIFMLAVPTLLELLRQALGYRFGAALLFYLAPTGPWLFFLDLLTTVLSVAIPIKIWNNARIEHRVQEQEQLLLAAKMEALASQIQPHFLFNTLASISSLIRSQPDTARMLIVKLSSLLRRLLRSHEHFVTLREEIEAVDEYLGIESVRFGPSLKIEKDLSPDSLDIVVPSMILQPLIENSIKHGLSRKVGEGRITIRSRRHGATAIVEIEDNGLGISEERLNRPMLSGIGLRNVNERLRVIYGANYSVKLHSEPGKGTCARIEIPELVVSERISA